jgi:hypothetical protein
MMPELVAEDFDVVGCKHGVEKVEDYGDGHLS